MSRRLKRCQNVPTMSTYEIRMGFDIAWLVQKVRTWQISVQACWCGIGRVCYSNNRILRLVLEQSMPVNVCLPDMSYVYLTINTIYVIDTQYIHTCQAETTTEYILAYVVFKLYVTIYAWELPLEIYIASIWFFFFQKKVTPATPLLPP